MDILSAVITLFLVMDPLGNLSVLKTVPGPVSGDAIEGEPFVVPPALMIAMERLMGMLLVKLAVQMLLDGIRTSLAA